MEINGHISDTAFLVNESRARAQAVSRDKYAELWVPEERRATISQLWDDFARAVYPHDDLELAIRNRFFADRMSRFVDANVDAVVVNIGAGFTSYPFLLDGRVQYTELDLPHVVAYKQRRINALQAAGLLPARCISFLSADLHTQSDRVENALANAVGEQPSFVLLEGISYYLRPRALEAVFQLVGNIQRKNSIFAFDFWKPDIVHHPVFARLQDFFHRRFGYPVTDYCLFDEEYIYAIHGYRPQTITNVVREEANYAGTRKLADVAQVLLENYAVLMRQ